MAGTLFVVATPIGNLEDVTLRALRVLREADLIAAEDTRRTAKLLMRHAISTPTTSFHEHNERQKVPTLLERLEGGDRIALVSDAGTPAVSDPGVRLVRAAVARGIHVEAIPGPSAVLAALVVSGLPTDGFLFTGFPPGRSAARRAWLESLAAETRTIVLFEAPHRVRDTLDAILKVLGNRRVALARELTKLHEEVLRGTVTDVIGRLAKIRGEITVVLEGHSTETASPSRPGDDVIWREFRQRSEETGASRRSAVVAAATTLGLSPREVYAAIERVKKLG